MQPKAKAKFSFRRSLIYSNLQIQTMWIIRNNQKAVLKLLNVVDKNTTPVVFNQWAMTKKHFAAGHKAT